MMQAPDPREQLRELALVYGLLVLPALVLALTSACGR